MPANVGEMAYYGTTPWHGLGVPTSELMSIGDVLSTAGQDWTVEKVPVPGARLDDSGNPIRYALIRRARQTRVDEQDVILGLCTRKYHPLQNAEALEFFESLLDDKAGVFETAGYLGDGQRVWWLAKLPSVISVSRNDVVDKFLLITNSHDGRESVSVKFTPVRVVCQNTLSLALANGESAVRVRHTRNVIERMRGLADLMGLTNQVYADAEEDFKAMAKIQLTAEDFNGYLARLFPLTDKQETRLGEQDKQPKKWNDLTELFEAHEDPETRGTVWAAYNSVTRYSDYHKTARDHSPDRRLERAWYGSGEALKLDALVQARELVRVRAA